LAILALPECHLFELGLLKLSSNKGNFLLHSRVRRIAIAAEYSDNPACVAWKLQCQRATTQVGEDLLNVLGQSNGHRIPIIQDHRTPPH
jgi:hypothetical protein